MEPPRQGTQVRLLHSLLTFLSPNLEPFPNRILADFMVATSCRHFAKLHGKWLIAHGLRHNFLLHLLNLWDNSLLNSRAIIDCMLIVDHIAVSTWSADIPVVGISSLTPLLFTGQ